jgi:hypothetical protein
MTDIDPTADIEVHRGFALVTVRIPLAGEPVSQDWLHHYNVFAHKRNAQNVQAEGVHPDRSWIVVQLPATTDRAAVQELMNTARGLISETDAAAQAPQAAETETVIRDWWAGQHG